MGDVTGSIQEGSEGHVLCDSQILKFGVTLDSVSSGCLMLKLEQQHVRVYQDPSMLNNILLNGPSPHKDGKEDLKRVTWNLGE